MNPPATCATTILLNQLIAEQHYAHLLLRHGLESIRKETGSKIAAASLVDHEDWRHHWLEFDGDIARIEHLERGHIAIKTMQADLARCVSDLGGVPLRRMAIRLSVHPCDALDRAYEIAG